MFQLVLLAAVAAGCGGTTVGDKGLFNFKESSPASLGGAASPSPSPTVAATAQATAKPTPSKAPQPTPTQKPQAAKFSIEIFSDTSGQPQFKPPAARVYVGTIITFTNRDSVPRSVVSDNGTFDSHPIGPGGTWSYTASAVGTFNYHDGTRPYAVAYFQVVSQ
jgi:plastocyanin